MKKRASVRPSKSEAIFGVVFGLVLVALGLFVITPMAGFFGLLWTLLAVIVTFYNVYLGYLKKYPEAETPVDEAAVEAAPADAVEVDQVRTQLARLEELHRSGIITAEELETKRQEVLQSQE